MSWKLSSDLHSLYTLKSFFRSPYVSVRSLKHNARKKNSPWIIFLTFSILTLACTLGAKHFLREMNYWDILIVSPTIYFFTEAMGAMGQILFPYHSSFSIHHSPLLSRGLGDFWGRRWNQWVQDWLRDISQFFRTSGRSKTILIAFLFSGLFHELMCNLPYWLVYKKSYFGTMMLYFLIQGLALWIDKKYIKVRSLFWKRVYCWCVIILPSPLFINVPLLTFLGLKHV